MDEKSLHGVELLELPHPSDFPLRTNVPAWRPHPNRLGLSGGAVTRRAGPSRRATSAGLFRVAGPAISSGPRCSTLFQYFAWSSRWALALVFHAVPVEGTYTLQAATRRRECLVQPWQRCGRGHHFGPAGARPDQPGDSARAEVRAAAAMSSPGTARESVRARFFPCSSFRKCCRGVYFRQRAMARREIRDGSATISVDLLDAAGVLRPIRLRE